MKKKGIIVAVNFILTLALVVAMSVNAKLESKACSWFKKVDVNVYVGNDNADGFYINVVRTKLTAKKLVKALEKQGAIAANVKVRKFVDNGDELKLNLSQAFADDIMSSGTAGEYIKIGSVVNTFLDAYDACRIVITVEGKTLESGHNVYDYPLEFMGNSEPEPTPEPQFSNVEFEGEQFLAIATLFNSPVSQMTNKYNIDESLIKTVNAGSGEKFLIVPKNKDVKISVQRLEFNDDFTDLVPTEELVKDVNGVCVINCDFIEYIPHIQVVATYGNSKTVLQLTYSGMDGTLVINDTQFVKDISQY